MASLLALKYTPIPGGIRIAPVAMTNQRRTTSVLCRLSRSKITKAQIKQSAGLHTDDFRDLSALIVSGYDDVKVDKQRGFARGKWGINAVESFGLILKKDSV